MKYWSLLLVLFNFNLQAAELSAEDIMSKSYEATRFSSTKAQADITLVDKNGNIRTRKIVTLSKLNKKSSENTRLSRFVSPKNIKGMATLLIEHSSKEDNIWVYLPSMKKVRRLSVNSKKDSFLGTDLSNGDVIGLKPSGWGHRLLREETFSDTKCWVIESVANERTAQLTGYTKRLSFISKYDFSLLKTDYWNEDSLLSKTIVASNFKEFDVGKSQPLVIEAKNLLTGHRSIINFTNFEVGVEVLDYQLSPRAMERQD